VKATNNQSFLNIFSGKQNVNIDGFLPSQGVCLA